MYKITSPDGRTLVYSYRMTTHEARARFNRLIKQADKHKINDPGDDIVYKDYPKTVWQFPDDGVPDDFTPRVCAAIDGTLRYDSFDGFFYYTPDARPIMDKIDELLNRDDSWACESVQRNL